MLQSTATLADTVMEVLNPLWGELLMFVIAIVVYFIGTGQTLVPLNLKALPLKSDKSKTAPNEASPAAPVEKPTLQRSGSGNQNGGEKASILKQLLQALRSEDPNLALNLSTEISASQPIPVKVISQLLLCLCKLPELSEEQALKLKGLVFDSKAFEAAAAEVQHRGQHSLQLCRRFLAILGHFPSARSEKAALMVMRGLSSDKTHLHAILKDVTAEGSRIELTRNLSKELLGLCRGPEADEAAKLVLDRIPGSANDEVTRQAKFISSCGKDGNLADALKVFQKVKDSGLPCSTFLYNCLLDACIKCGDHQAALTYFAEMKTSVTPDVVTYNTMMRGYLIHGDTKSAQELMTEMQEDRGITPSRITYQALLSGLAQAGETTETWKIIDEMQKANIQVGGFALSIMLKAINDRRHGSELCRIVSVIDESMKHDSSKPVMDDVNFGLFQEACIKTGSLDLLWERTGMYCFQSSTVKLNASTCGSMIRGFGQARQVERCILLWETMLERNVKLSSVAVGCMVEALVTNANPDEAWKLVNTIWEVPEQRCLINTVIYSMILKGYAMTKKYNRVRSLYHEMTARGIPCNTIAYNTMLNALALCGQMQEVPELLAHMKNANPPLVPDVITFSTIIKGYCMAGEVDKSLDLLQEMRSSQNIKPDEVMYNSLLDGCAKQNRLETALELLEEMKASGVIPSNYTLSIVCKLMGRSKQVDQAVAIVDSISNEYGFKPNIQVYTCLIQACIYNRKLAKALCLHDKIVDEAICCPDEKTYSSMTRGFLQMGCSEKAMQVVRCAFHLPSHQMKETKGKPQGVEQSLLPDVVAQVGYNSAAGQSLIDDLYEFCKIKVRQEDCQAALLLRKQRSGGPHQARAKAARKGKAAE
eukprot:TRINITY_DN93808_c0_g1_i1.p1 TRINITY_DN93808_c0_g1~~TRINITY_DN93808_c0_g1_i1.p1  ORF type:complete len:877 (-),score=223.62 TRINITY_DN93808_c0_g1_i1:386-3016(-)